jgi:SEC-C motif domain protein
MHVRWLIWSPADHRARLACPCGLGDGYASCCGRLHAGAPAPTAESLIRSRYSAFAVSDAGYLLRTWNPSSRPRTHSLDPALRWTRLAVLETRDGGLFETTGTVQFRAMYVHQGSAASSRKRASSSGKTGTEPTSVPLTKGRLPPALSP